MIPATYHHSEVFRFRHVKPGNVFEVTKEAATRNVPAGYYVRASARKALACTYDEWTGPHIDANTCGVVYVPANLPVKMTQV
jgi:hypothetical protein